MKRDVGQALGVLEGLAASGSAGGRVHLSLDGAVAELVIDHPEARHALSVAMMVELARAVLTLADWPGAALVVRSSTPDAFCAGGHLGEVRRHLAHGDAGRQMAQAMSAVLDGLWGLPQVSVAVLEGPAVGGGAEVATAADHRVMHPSAWLQFRQAALGVAAGWGGVHRLVHHVGAPTALRWTTTAARLEPEALRASGFVQAIAADPLAQAHAWLAPLLALPAAGVRACKLQVAASRVVSSSVVHAETEAFASVWGGPAHRATFPGEG